MAEGPAHTTPCALSNRHRQHITQSGLQGCHLTVLSCTPCGDLWGARQLNDGEVHIGKTGADGLATPQHSAASSACRLPVWAQSKRTSSRQQTAHNGWTQGIKVMQKKNDDRQAVKHRRKVHTRTQKGRAALPAPCTPLRAHLSCQGGMAPMCLPASSLQG